MTNVAPFVGVLASDVLIDISRQHPPAVAWITSLPVLPPVAGMAALELLAGCRNRTETLRAQNLLRPMPHLWLPEAAQSLVPFWFAPLSLSSSLGVLDAMIAATAMAHGVPLFTFNVKHFAVTLSPIR